MQSKLNKEGISELRHIRLLILLSSINKSMYQQSTLLCIGRQFQLLGYFIASIEEITYAYRSLACCNIFLMKEIRCFT